jgi:hypothetical protein
MICPIGTISFVHHPCKRFARLMTIALKVKAFGQAAPEYAFPIRATSVQSATHSGAPKESYAPCVRHA